MELVIRNVSKSSAAYYMALYHAGIAAYWANKNDHARELLEEFLQRYHNNDAFTGNAKRALARIAQGLPADSSIPKGE